MFRNLLAGATIALLSTPAATQIVVDPGGGGDYTELQAAIDAAAPFSVIRVVGGSYGAIAVDRTLTIIGDPMPEIVAPRGGIGPFQPAAIELQGSGSDALTLVNLRVGGGLVSELEGFAVAGPAIDGAGFTRLHVQDCVVSGPEWTDLDGIKPGAQAIRLEFAQQIAIVRSELTASRSVAMLVNDVFPPNGVAAIDAPGAQVFVTGSTIRGSSVGPTVIEGIPPLPAPCPCPAHSGDGGPGIVAAGVTVVGSIVRGGDGSEVTHFGQPWGHQLDGVPIVATRSDALPETLVSTGSPALDSQYFAFFAPSPTSVSTLMFGAPRENPIPVLGALLFLDLFQPITPLPVSAGQSVYGFQVGSDPSLAGLTFALQLGTISSTLTLSNPVFETITF